jgi:hypothetical protein
MIASLSGGAVTEEGEFGAAFALCGVAALAEFEFAL